MAIKILCTMFADTHAHPVMKYVHNERDNLWDSFKGPVSLKGLINTLIKIPAFSQADFRTLAEGNVQIVFCALHPPEQKIMFHNFQYSGSSGFLEDIASQAISIPHKKIDLCQREDYDHFKQLHLELALLMTGIASSFLIKKNGQEKTAKYVITKNFSEIRKITERNKTDKNQHTVAVVLTVEGLHALGCGHVNFKNKPLNPLNVPEEKLLDRLDTLKGISNGEGQGWIFTPVVANITHAFDNGLCGQAQALSGMFQALFDYAEPYGPSNGPQITEGLNKPLSDIGRKVILRMLNLDEVSKNRVNPGRRIIPDIKHMSTRARKQYYEIIDTHNILHPADKVPVIMSHAGVNGKARLDDHLDPEDLEIEWESSAGFNPWSINLFDDEIVRIHKTKGLIGIIFDERVLAGGRKLKALRGKITGDLGENDSYFKGKNKKRRWALLIVDQIFHVIKTVKKSGAADWKAAWDIICIGSDFDGQINPLDCYCKATDYDLLKKVMHKMMRRDQRFEELLNGLQTDEIIEKICFKNVFGFLERHYH